MTSDLKDLENFHGEGYFEIGFEVWVRVQWGWVGLVKADEPKNTDSGKQSICWEQEAADLPVMGKVGDTVGKVS